MSPQLIFGLSSDPGHPRSLPGTSPQARAPPILDRKMGPDHPWSTLKGIGGGGRWGRGEEEEEEQEEEEQEKCLPHRKAGVGGGRVKDIGDGKSLLVKRQCTFYD